MAENAHSTPVSNAEGRSFKRDAWLCALGEEYRLLETALDEMRRVSIALEMVYETMMSHGNRVKESGPQLHYVFMSEQYDALSHLIYDLGGRTRKTYADWDRKLEELKACA